MKQLKIDSKMLAALGGVFYPTGHAMVMYPSEAQARDTANRLFKVGFTGDNIYLISGATVLQEITPTVAQADAPLPSVGSEAGDVRRYTELAREGHWGLLIESRDAQARNRMVAVVNASGYSIARLYRTFVIEDLAPQGP